MNTNPDARVRQALELKFQYADEDSEETYLGLTQDDFDAEPFRRYAGSQEDLMTTEHMQFALTHTLDLSDNFRITTVGYRNNFKRNWYKLDYLTLNGDRVGISDILEDPDTFDPYYQVVSGFANSPDDALSLKNNNREYLSTGIQTKLDYHWTGKKDISRYRSGPQIPL